MRSHESQLSVTSSAIPHPSQYYTEPIFQIIVNFAYLRSKLFVETLANSEPIIINNDLTNFQSRPSTILVRLSLFFFLLASSFVHLKFKFKMDSPCLPNFHCSWIRLKEFFLISWSNDFIYSSLLCCYLQCSEDSKETLNEVTFFCPPLTSLQFPRELWSFLRRGEELIRNPR